MSSASRFRPIMKKFLEKDEYRLFARGVSWVFWCSIVFLRFCPSWQLSCDQNDLEALLVFKNKAFAAVELNWTKAKECCDWEGVTCDADARILKLQLPARGLRGSLSDSLGSLSNLRELNLSHNQLRGSIPNDLLLLPHLQLLDLSFNRLQGNLTTLNGLGAIQLINISSNLFGGKFPRSDLLPHLRALNVSNNSFTGSIPLDLCRNSSVVTVLDFSSNKFQGQLDGGLGECKNLLELSVGSNSLVGFLPYEIYSIRSLRKISAQSNRISGKLNESIGNLSNLTDLWLYDNEFSGELPGNLGNLVQLEQLDLHSNYFVGNLPVSISQCTNLQVLNLRNNSLTGNIDIDFSTLPHLVNLDLASNKFSGWIPNSLSYCRRMKSLSLAKNRLEGKLPDSIADLASLSFLSISNNSLRNISEALRILQGLNNLSVLILTKNFHGEPIPEEVNGFPSLRVFALGNCALSGKFPSWLKNCSKLSVLDLSWNNLTGPVPSWIGAFQFLFYIDISNNSFSGEIPRNLTNLPTLVSRQAIEEIDQTTFELPLFVKHVQNTTGLQYNQLSYFPPAIYLSRNNINGSLWPEFGRMQTLHVLDVKGNNLTGVVPQELSNMTNLEILDLSDNSLSGNIPTVLQDLTFLSRFNVANNHLEGVIPSGRQFSTFSASSFLGNPGLCGGPLGPCHSNSNTSNNTRPFSQYANVTSSNRLNRKAVAGIAVGVGCAVALLLSVLLWSLSRQNMVSDADINEPDCNASHRSSDASGSSLLLIFQNHDLKDLSIADIFKATNNFDQANIIGCGGFGLVYKATFANGTKAAIKKLTGDCGQMEREFRAEVEALSRAQHKNLVSLQGYCRYGNCRLLIYSYLENGSLDYWLHEKSDGASSLDWPTRLRIAQGASKGLAYMHRIDPHIVHRDIKSSNILLDEQFEGYVADFGLSRLILPYNTHVTTELVGTLGYIPPEYGQAWVATLRGDVYSFGVVILELLTGRRPVEVTKAKVNADLVTWVHQMRAEGRQGEIFDPFLCGKGHENQMLQVLDVACMCTNECPFKRPTIQDVVDWLDDVGKDK